MFLCFHPSRKKYPNLVLVLLGEEEIDVLKLPSGMRGFSPFFIIYCLICLCTFLGLVCSHQRDLFSLALPVQRFRCQTLAEPGSAKISVVLTACNYLSIPTGSRSTASY